MMYRRIPEISCRMLFLFCPTSLCNNTFTVFPSVERCFQNIILKKRAKVVRVYMDDAIKIQVPKDENSFSPFNIMKLWVG